MVVADACFVMHASATTESYDREIAPSRIVHNIHMGFPDLVLRNCCNPQLSKVFHGDFSTEAWDFPTKTRVAPWEFLTILLIESN